MDDVPTKIILSIILLLCNIVTSLIMKLVHNTQFVIKQYLIEKYLLGIGGNILKKKKSKYFRYDPLEYFKYLSI